MNNINLHIAPDLSAALTTLLLAIVVYLTTKVNEADKRLTGQEKSLDTLTNTGGDTKIELKVRSMQGEGKIPMPTAPAPPGGVPAPITAPAPIMPPITGPSEGIAGPIPQEGTQ